MDSDTLCSIGELSRRTGLTVKTIRFYSDRGIVPPTDRSPAGYRLYGPDVLTRLDLARTLRELGPDLATVRKVLDQEASLSEVTQAHADGWTCRSAPCACAAPSFGRSPDEATPPLGRWT